MIGPNVTSHTNYITNSPSSNKIYNKEFYESVNCVIGSVDNYMTREHINNRCVLFKTPYIDCGSESFNGHVQIVIPNLTVTYTSTNDNINNPTYPLCSIASFPSKFEHCILWAKEQYEIIFNRNVQLFKKYLDDQIITDDTHKETLLNMFNSIPNSHEGCYLIATKVFKKLYCDMIDELLNKFPSDFMLDDGTPFWTLPKICPHIIDSDNGFINKFVKLWMNIFNTHDYHFDPVDTIPEDLSIYKKITININKDESKMIHCMSVLRAMNYNIECFDEFNSIGFIENIIPRLVGNSAMVAGLACLEYYKIIMGNVNHKNHFIDTHNNEFLKVDPVIYKKVGTYGIWDSFMFSSKSVETVKDLINAFDKDYNITITAILYGSFMFYSEIFDESKLNERFNMKIVDIIEKEYGKIVDDNIILQVYDDSDDDTEFPDVIFYL
jgi:hypothetical protein